MIGVHEFEDLRKPELQAAPTGLKEKHEILLNEDVLEYKLGWQCSLSKLNFRATFSSSGIPPKCDDSCWMYPR